MSITRFGALALVFAFSFLVACQPAPDFESCVMTEKMLADCKAQIEAGLDQCRESEVYCFDTCLVGDHPSCYDGPCIKFEGRKITEAVVVDSDPICATPCHGIACPHGSTCRELPAGKKACTADSDCGELPWSVCEDTRKCGGTGLLCETAADCKDGKTCDVVPDAQKFCTWKFCIPDPE